MGSEAVEALKRRVRILELKLVFSRAETTMAAASGPPFLAAMADEEGAMAELEKLKLTDEEKAL